MAAIGTIRKYSGIAVGLIGISILAFVLTDAFSTRGVGGLLRNQKNVVGIIGGKEISYQDFQARIEDEVQKYKENKQLENVDENIRSQIRDELWNQMSDEIIYDHEYDRTGITVSAEELNYMVTGPDPNPSVKQAFTDPKTGVFNKAMLINFLKNMDKDEKYKNMWLDFEKNLVKERNKQKYFDLIKNSLYVTNLEAQENYYGRNKFATFEYLTLPIKSIPDSTVKYNDKDIQEAYKKYCNLYEIEESRSFDYVSFDIIPTKPDTAELLKQMVKMKEDFKNTKNDSLYVMVNSDVRFDTLYHSRGFYPESFENLFFSGKKDTVIGPYFENNKYNLAKLVNTKIDTIYYYKASHILIKPLGPTNKDTADALKKARDILSQVKRGGDFADLARKNSGDNGSAIKGGDLGWFKDGQMVKPFNDAVKKGKKGDLVVVKSQFGAHLIKITENKSNVIIRVGVIQKSVEPSSETFQMAFSKATKFRSRINKSEDFDRLIKEQELIKKNASEIKPNEKQIPGVQNARKLITWAYSAKDNGVSDILEMDDKFIVAHLMKIRKKGLAPLEDIKKDIITKLIKDKKLETLEKKLKDANLKAHDLDNIAKIVGASRDKATNVSFGAPVLPVLGEEKTLIGYVFGTTPGKLSPPIKGDNGVFQIILKEYSKVEAPKNINDSKRDIYGNYQGMSQYETIETLKEEAKIQDYRYKFY